MPTVTAGNNKIQRQVRGAVVPANSLQGGGTLFSEPVLALSQKATLVEVNAEYEVFNQHGRKIGAIREIGQNILKNAFAVRAPGDRTHRFQVVNAGGNLVLALTRPAKFFRSRLIVRDANGREICQIAQKSLGIIGAVRFTLESGGQQLGSLNAEGWNAWDFNMQDMAGNEVGRITKTWAVPRFGRRRCTPKPTTT